MSRSVIARFFVGGMAALGVGMALGLASVELGSATQIYVIHDGAITGLRVSPVGFAVVGLAAASTMAFVGGALAVVVAWAAALINARDAGSQRWLVGLLALGLPTIGVGALIAYVVAGPDRVSSRI